MKRNYVAWICAFLMLSSVFVGLQVNENAEARIAEGDGVLYTPHAPIRIDSDADFPGIASGGDGSAGSPWIIENHEINGTGHGYCIYIGNTTEHFIVRNSFVHNADGLLSWPYYTDSGLTLYNVQNGVVSNNTAASNLRQGFLLHTSSNNTIVDNNVSSLNLDGILLYSSSKNTIRNNTATFNNDFGICLSLSNNNTISSNNVSFNNNNGMYIVSSTNNTFSGNYVASNNDNGMHLISSSNNSLANNSIMNNDDYGILIETSINNTLTHNTMYMNLLRCLTLRFSNSNYITNNNLFSNNGCSIMLDSSYNNSIYHNNIINSAFAFDNTGFNSWDNGYPDGGNYWSTFNTSLYVGNESFFASGGEEGFYLDQNENTPGFQGIQTLHEIRYVWDNDWSFVYVLVEGVDFDINITTGWVQVYWGGFVLGDQLYSEYTCLVNPPDLFWGPNQDIPDSDFIYDMPYPILGGTNEDSYPLAYPIINGRFQRGPIRIDSNADFDQAHGVINWDSGDGSIDNPWIIEKWDINGTGHEFCIYVGNTTDYFEVRGNSFHNASGFGVIIRNCYYGIILDNEIIYNNNNGIYLPLSFYITIQNCKILYNSNSGIYLNEASRLITIENNTISYNAGNGIETFYSWGNKIYNNVISNNDGSGIGTFAGSKNIIKQNTISNNQYAIALLLFDGNGSIIKQNTISNNQYGIYTVFSSSNISYYHNNFINNTIQAYDDGTNNTWDNGYPDGGNYWSDYSGVDLNSTPSQDIPPPDGIGDTPYTDIDGVAGTIDNYPLMEPWMPPPILTYDIDLTTGWNLISLPLAQSDEDIYSVLSSIDGDWDRIKLYDSQSVNHWLSSSIYSPDLSEIDQLNHTVGIWIHMVNATTLTVEGIEPVFTNITLYAGWNLVGYPSLFPETVANALWGTGADRVEVCDLEEPGLIKEVGPTYIMQPGEGYWVHVPADTVWTTEKTVGNPQIVVRGDNPDTGGYEYIRFNNTEPVNGDTISITATIQNLGGGSAAVDVKYYDGEEISSQLIGTDYLLLPAQGEIDAVINWKASPGGAHSIIVTAEVNATYALVNDIYDPYLPDNRNSTAILVMPKILLVDDDNHTNDYSLDDTTSYMRDALRNANFEYDFVIVGPGDGPGYDYGDYPLEDYDIVIWMTGHTETNTLTRPLNPAEPMATRTDDVANLMRFLDGESTGGNGGSLWLISEGYWDDAIGDPVHEPFFMNYLHLSDIATTPMPSLKNTLPTELWGRENHTITNNYADNPINTEIKVAGTDAAWSWASGDFPDTSAIALNNSDNSRVYGVTYDSDDYPADPIADSRIFVQTWDFSRIQDTATQAQYAYKAIRWLENYSMMFERDVAISQQTIEPTTVTINETINITAIVRNNGFNDYNSSQGDNLWYLLRITDEYNNDITVPHLERIDYLGIGSNNEFIINHQFTFHEIGNFTVWIEVDPYNYIIETNELNNQASEYYNTFEIEVLP
ncbi:MAG: right-handed parallel beta-helix repeat-containing protein [Thermoplasmata archaeon]|nr:right-handed parallel beta-helix repeat-containing protein [Thermoplasmata archaeon]